MGDGRDDVIGKNEDSDSGDNFSSISLASQDQESSSPTDDDSQHFQESDFEFGCVPPSSPTNDLNKSSPADVLFFNGRLLPHAFPSESSVKNNIGRINGHRSHVSSRTSSISSSKDSLLSSRSNSRSSSCSSTGRTSSCENIEKRLLGSSEQPSDDQIATRRVPITRNQMSNRSIRLQSQVSNQRWQFIAPAPILTPTTSIPPRRKRGEILVPEELRSKKQVKNNKNKRSSTWFVPRFFRSFMSTCRACHALEPSKRGANLS
ncbi:uncharacterized protein LOC122082799 [Macadamia integrifolia]|uniref:uncharacterized protein LOC122082799 n=1 Tax=Macadamia integrifolia TaxID=60698 RepID=UPI001C4F6BFB|nr:uncharacterized protein LOC122082799 [Macadamia integrifolia]